MELSPEGKKRIYEEEKVRLGTQEKIKKGTEASKRKKENKSTKQGYIGYLVMIIVIFVITLTSGCSGCFKGPEELTPSVTFTGAQFIITNRDNFDWTNVEVIVNATYVLKIQRINAGKIYTVDAREFTKKDGTRFNPVTMKPNKMKIWCDTPKGKGVYDGVWE